MQIGNLGSHLAEHKATRRESVRNIKQEKKLNRQRLANQSEAKEVWDLLKGSGQHFKTIKIRLKAIDDEMSVSLCRAKLMIAVGAVVFTGGI